MVRAGTVGVGLPVVSTMIGTTVGVVVAGLEVTGRADRAETFGAADGALSSVSSDKQSTIGPHSSSRFQRRPVMKPESPQKGNSLVYCTGNRREHTEVAWGNRARHLVGFLDS